MAMDFREPNEVLWRGVRPAHKGDQVAGSGNAVNEVTILYTVPTDKKLYLWYANIAVYANDAGGGDMRVRDDDNINQFRIFWVKSVTANLTYNLVFSPGIPLEVPADWDIFISSNNPGIDVRGFIFGFEE